MNRKTIREKVWVSSVLLEEIDSLILENIESSSNRKVLHDIHQEVAVARARFTLTSEKHQRHARALGKNPDEVPLSLSVEERLAIIELSPSKKLGTFLVRI